MQLKSVVYYCFDC